MHLICFLHDWVNPYKMNLLSLKAFTYFFYCTMSAKVWIQLPSIQGGTTGEMRTGGIGSTTT